MELKNLGISQAGKSAKQFCDRLGVYVNDPMERVDFFLSTFL
jgi:ribosome-associated protein YbcJ (S4-like RNA binding protein)